MKNIKRYTIIVLAVIGGFDVVARAFALVYRNYLASDGPGGVVVLSPDKMNKAVLYSEVGGGGISPYCFDYISVVPATIKNSEANKDKYRIYAASCHTFQDPATNNGTNAPYVKWLSDDELEIQFSATEGARGIDHLTLKGYADHGKIRIKYKNHG